MDNKVFGQKVRRLREEKGLTRELFCEDEAELSVRQLTRIETGASKPTLTKINYIASRLGTSLYELMPDYVGLPAEYIKIKYHILRTPTYGEPSKVEERDVLLMEIYNKFYDELPEEEQLAIDALQCAIDVHTTITTDFGEGIIDDYFHQICEKAVYQVNDLLILSLFVERTYSETLDKGTKLHLEIKSLVPKLIEQIVEIDPKDLFILRDLLFLIIGTLGQNKDYDVFPIIFEGLDEIMKRTQDFQKKPILSMLKWKYELFANRDTEAARFYYEEAVAFAGLVGNEYVKERMIHDWEIDLTEM